MHSDWTFYTSEKPTVKRPVSTYIQSYYSYRSYFLRECSVSQLQFRCDFFCAVFISTHLYIHSGSSPECTQMSPFISFFFYSFQKQNISTIHQNIVHFTCKIQRCRPAVYTLCPKAKLHLLTHSSFQKTEPILQKLSNMKKKRSYTLRSAVWVKHRLCHETSWTLTPPPHQWESDGGTRRKEPRPDSATGGGEGKSKIHVDPPSVWSQIWSDGCWQPRKGWKKRYAGVGVTHTHTVHYQQVVSGSLNPRNAPISSFT